MNYEKIVTLYDTAEHGEAARRNLAAAGFAPSEMSMVSKGTKRVKDNYSGGTVHPVNCRMRWPATGSGALTLRAEPSWPL